ncbi:MAG: FeoB-associated Cys-rich membrane protein, partial [Staphylococcus epidermidis]|nr:FeoB-associated Cys-rich membrane protein [Staphylococcus epidermidis]
GDCGGCKSNCKCDTKPSPHKNKLNIPHIKS